MNYSLKNIITILLFSPLIIHSHYLFAEKQYPEIISQNIVLKISSLEITEYEFIKNIKKLINYYSQKNENDCSFGIKNIISEYLDKNVFIADAKNNGYYENPEIIKEVNAVSRFMMTQDRGDLYNEIIGKKILVTDEDVIEAHHRRHKEYEIEFIFFSEIDIANDYAINESSYVTIEKFNELKELSKNKKSITFGKKTIRWPFSSFVLHNDYIYMLKENEISRPLIIENGLYLLQIKRIIPYEPRPFDKEKVSLRRALEITKEMKLKHLYKNNILKNSNHKTNEAIINLLIKHLDFSKNIFFLNSEDYKALLPEILMSYNLDNKFVEISVGEFIEFYNTLAVRSSINNKSDLISYAHDMIYEYCAYSDAVKHGLHKRPKFILDKKDYKNNVVYDRYILNELLSKITIRQEEIQNSYNNQIDTFKEATHVNLSMLAFDYMYYLNPILKKHSKVPAENNKLFINLPDTTKGLLEKRIRFSIPYDSEEFPQNIMNLLFESDDNTFIPSRRIDGRFLLFFKHNESGKRVKSFEEVKKELTIKLRRSKLELLKMKRLEELKKKYLIENHTEYSKLFN
ncbi:hypothetical protein ACFL6P_00165 [Candidatus Latescibacterota bacterium]